MSEHAESIRAAMKCLDDWIATFNARDLAGYEATFNFPSVRLGSDGFVTYTAGMQSPDVYTALEAMGWHHSSWTRRRVLHAGPDKVHIDVGFARHRADGGIINSYDAIYIVTRERGHWGVKFRSSYS